MVLQRERPIHVWGWADPGEQVSVTLASQSRTAVADRLGSWSVSLAPLAAGGPFQLTVAARNRIVLDDVLLGDVWFASGQSNMEMPLKGFSNSAVVKNGAEEIAQANNPKLRLFLAHRKASPIPLIDLPGDVSWTACTPETAANFSAVAYFFGREIAARENVPVGLIDSTWGGTPAEAWTSLESIASDAALMPVFAAHAAMTNEQANLPAILAAEKREDELARTEHRPVPKHPWRPDPASWAPSWLYNGMAAPFTSLSIKGVVWYQGESNTGPERAFLYERLFKTMISDWRSHWAQGDFPFLFVQISSFNAGENVTGWPLVREAQRRALALRNTAMAVTVDVGDPDNVHPADKQTVGFRLALAARALAYGEPVEYSGPAFRQVTEEPGALRVWFDHAAGLKCRGANLEDFEIAGEDRHFLAAAARIDGSTVLVSNSQITAPRYVRYAWRNVPAANLYNSAGLPASPFTSESNPTAH
jgi:sialate O-acetylesterase